MNPIHVIVIFAFAWFCGLMAGIGFAKRPCRVCERRKADTAAAREVEKQARAIQKRLKEMEAEGNNAEGKGEG